MDVFGVWLNHFDQWDGINRVVSGYSGGILANPTYEDVKSGKTGHYEVVQITFDPKQMPYEKLLEIYWQQIDPTDAGGQFHDRGDSYRTVIFYHNEAQKIAAEKSLKNQKKNWPLVANSRNRSSLRLNQQKHFTLLKIFTKTFIKKTKRTI